MNRILPRQGWWIGIAAIMLAAVGVFATRENVVIGQDGGHATAPPPAKTPADLKNDPVIHHAKALSKAFRDAADVATPSVVTIRSHASAKRISSNAGNNPLKRGPGRGDNPFKGTPFEDMFPDLSERFGGEKFNWQTPPRNGVGSGVIIDSTGIVLTNNHVVEGADKVSVILADGSEYEAFDIKTDPQSDLAVLRIKGEKSFPAAHLGDSDELAIGDWVIAIGTPFELDKTVSAGIISGKERQLGAVQRAKFLQTDAAINPGNSGGPLVNLNGEVVGINTAIASNSGGYQGIGFAIPINQAKWVTEQLIRDGSVHRGYLGVAIGEISSELASKFGVAKGEGVLVGEVFPNTPAADAKLQDGDVILNFAGRKVSNPRELQEIVERSPLNKAQPMEILRDGNKMTVDVTVKPLPDNFGRTGVESGPKLKEAPAPDIYGASDLGIEVAEMSSEDAAKFEGYNGVVIHKVDPNSVAAEKGLQPGMLIRKVGKTPVKSVEDFKAALKNESLQDGILMHVRTQLGNRFIVLQSN